MDYPYQLYACAILLLILIVEAGRNIKRPWSIPAIGVYLTTLGWYFVDPFQLPEVYQQIPREILGLSYLQVGMFLITFRWLLPKLAQLYARNLDLETLQNSSPEPTRLFAGLAGLWILLLTIAVWKMDWNLVGALFPLEGRAGEQMWSRGALGGTWDSLVSVGYYSYQFVCGLLGVTIVLQKNSIMRLMNLLLWLISIPFFLLSGTRSIFIAAIAPLFFTYFLVGKQPFYLRAILLGIAGVAVHFVLLTVIENRNTGFRFLVNDEARVEKEMNEQAEGANVRDLGVVTDKKRTQQGMNMIEELCFINQFSESGVFEVEFGKRYLTELTNVIPRALWPGKPMLGIDYAIWRGFGNNAGGIGVNATISTGMIGGGILNFGQWLGPPVAGLILAAWAGLLTRWWLQRKSILRLCLFMAGLGLTFNLGRDITLLVLWPVVFGYVLVRLAEKFSSPKHKATLPGNISRWKTTNPALRQS